MVVRIPFPGPIISFISNSFRFPFPSLFCEECCLRCWFVDAVKSVIIIIISHHDKLGVFLLRIDLMVIWLSRMWPYVTDNRLSFQTKTIKSFRKHNSWNGYKIKDSLKLRSMKNQTSFSIYQETMLYFSNCCWLLSCCCWLLDIDTIRTSCIEFLKDIEELYLRIR